MTTEQIDRALLCLERAAPEQEELHPSSTWLIRHLTGSGTPEQRADVEEHLSHCAQCQALHQSCIAILENAKTASQPAATTARTFIGGNPRAGSPVEGQRFAWADDLVALSAKVSPVTTLQFHDQASGFYGQATGSRESSDHCSSIYLVRRPQPGEALPGPVCFHYGEGKVSGPHAFSLQNGRFVLDFELPIPWAELLVILEAGAYQLVWQA
jgi:hypothetical protein